MILTSLSFLLPDFWCVGIVFLASTFMQVIKDIRDLQLADTVVTTGNFDGIHLGHQFVLNQLVDLAHRQDCRSVLVMFSPHPREVLGYGGEVQYLSSADDKLELIEACGVDVVVQVHFDLELASWGSDDFVKKILLDKLGMTHFLVGYDHRLGNPKKSVSLDVLAEKYGFSLELCLPFELEFGKISSSIIREKLLIGDVLWAAQLLGRPYSLKCTVVRGQKLGRTISFPTANLVPVAEKMLIPGEGVYAVRVLVRGELCNGMMQIGHRPTLDDGRGLSIEVHLFDFDKCIYDDEVEVFFVEGVRSNKRFENIEALRLQLVNDEKQIRAILL